MNKYAFWIVVFVMTVGTIGFVVLKKPQDKPRLGTEHPDQGATHIAQGQPHDPYNSDPPSSGPHYADQSSPAPWGAYIEEVPEEVFIHNQEHGGIIITYKPDLPADQIKKLQDLFTPPYSNQAFKPTKAIVTPRSKNTKPIALASWRRTLSLDTYDEKVLMEYYLSNVGSAPEGSAGPTNTPINQAQ